MKNINMKRQDNVTLGLKYMDYLNYLANGGEPHNVMCGTCDSFEEEFEVKIRDSIPNYYRVIREFEYYSGDTEFPIKWKGVNDNPVLVYTICKNKWIGEYGRRRRLFCKFLADYLNKIINYHTMNNQAN